MLDIAWPELIVIGAVALVAIGPKDLPKVMRTAGQWVGKARHMVQDVQRSFDQLNYETEVAERLQRAQKADAATTPLPPVMLPLAGSAAQQSPVAPPAAPPSPVTPTSTTNDRPDSTT